MTAVLPDLTFTSALVPGPARLRLRPVPDTEPRADPSPYCGSEVRRSGQPTLALAVAPTEPTTPTPPMPPARAAQPAREPALGQVGGPQLPDPELWARRLAQAVVEVLCGVRPVGQLLRWTNRTVYESLRRRSSGLAQLPAHRPVPTQRAVVRSVRVCPLGPGVVEASAVVVSSGRVRAVALRLEAAAGRWRMTALELG